MSLESRCLDAFDCGDHEEAVRLLPLVKGPKYSIRLSDDTSLLHLSSRNGWLDITKDLITKYHCDPHERGDGGQTCLHYAAQHDHVDVIKYLIFERHCDTMATDTMGRTPLHIAAAFSRSVEYLLSTGKCDPSAKDSVEKTSFKLAKENGNTDTLSVLKKFGGIKSSHPIDSYVVNVLLVGNPKSTLTHVINDTASFTLLGSFRNVGGVVPCTAGIILYKLHHRTLGNMIIWVVVSKGILLAEVDGILFAPEKFKEHVDIASNTGIVSVFGLTRLFPQYNPGMLIRLLRNMELLLKLNPSFLRMTNLCMRERGGESLFFFPSLLSTDRPKKMTSEVYQFGWCLQCTSKHDFFPPQFFHVLSLHLTYKFSLSKERELAEKFKLKCVFWNNGLHWSNGQGVGSLVEIVDESQCVLVMMSCEKGYSDNMVPLSRDGIGEVMSVYKESCPSIEVKKLVIDPKELAYPVNIPRERIVYSVKAVMSIDKKEDFLVNNATGTRRTKLKEVLPNESLSDISNLSLLGGRDIKEVIEITEQFKTPLTPIKLGAEVSFKCIPTTRPTVQPTELDELKGVHIAARNSFLIHGGSTQSVNWEEYGIRITIPQGAVLPSDTVVLTIAALVGGDFIFPEDTELVSAVYAINITTPFLQPVKLEIQHCVSIETASHCNYLSFATSTNNQPPYQFDTVDGGEFFIGNRYGSISVATFSKYSVTKKSKKRRKVHRKESKRKLHTVLSSSNSLPVKLLKLSQPSHDELKLLASSIDPQALSPTSSSSKNVTLMGTMDTTPTEDEAGISNYPIPGPSSFLGRTHTHSSFLPLPTIPVIQASFMGNISARNLADELPKFYYGKVVYEVKRPGREWLMRFLLCKDLNALLEHINKTFQYVEGIEVSFQFKDDDGFIELCFDDKQCPKGWSVRPHQDPTRVGQACIDEYGSMSPPRFPECLITITATPGEDAVTELSYPVVLKGVISNVEKINIELTMGDIQQASAGSVASNSGPISPDHEERKIVGKVLQENFDTLSKILAAPNNLLAVIMSLYTKELISDVTLTECMNTGRPVHDRCASLLFALKATIEGKPQAMNTLIEVLKYNEAFKEIADKMDLDLSYLLYTGTFDDREKALRKVEENVVTDGIDRQRKIEKWLKEGKVELEITRINMHGAPGAGKTCSQHLLLNEPPPEKLTDSTPIACPAVKAIRISIDDKNKKWERVNEKDLLNQLASCLNEAPNETEHKKLLREAPMPTKAVPLRLNDSSLKVELSKKEPLEKKPLQKKPTEMEVIKEIVSALEAEKFKQLSSNWVYFIDSGGQPAYRELLPLFTRAAALNIITIDLTKGLDEKHEFHYRFDQFQYPINMHQRYSNRDIIQSTVSSGAMFNPTEIPYVSESDKHKDIHPRYFVLGTRKDKLEENGTLDKLNEMNKVLLEEYKANIKVITNPQDQDSIIYPVDTMLPEGPEREEASIALCTKISSFGVAMTIHIPIRLFTFEISLQREAKNKKRSFLTKQEVKEIGKSLQLDDELDIDEALQYLHNVTIILYYPAVLPNLIFVDPKPILDTLSCLIASTYINRTETDNLRKLGLFNEDLLQLFGKKIFHYVDFKSSHMIKLLIHLHIIAKVENRKEGDYFFPCALPSHGELLDPPTEIQPLLIAWEIDERDETTLAIPQGLFLLTIVHLLEKKDEIRFSPDNLKLYYKYNNAMTLRVYKKYHIDIINRYTHLEIHVRGHCRDICPQIRELVSKAVKDSSKDLKLKEDNKFVFAFKCPPGNTCIIQEDKCFTLCTHCEDQCDVLQGDDDSYKCWFSDCQSSNPGAPETGIVRKRTHSMKGAESSLKGPPTKRFRVQLDINCLVDILDLLKKHGYSGVDYYDLGLYLGLLPSTLDVIGANNKGDVCTCLRECLKKWLEQADNVMKRGGPTYDALIQALRKIEKNAVASGIKRDINTN